MSNQQQDRDRQGTDDMPVDGNTDTTRSQNRQGVEEEARRTTAGTDRSEGSLAEDKGPHRDDASHTGSHAEGNYPKNGEGMIGKPGDKPE